MTDHQNQKQRGKIIHIIGPHGLQNELLAMHLKEHAQAACLCHQSLRQLLETDPPPPRDTGARLLLIDSLGVEPRKILHALAGRREICSNNALVALINLTPGLDIEARALELGVKGLFYRQDPLRLFLKGVQALFAGELWVRRNILTKCYLQTKSQGRAREKTHPLTNREVEILGLVASGAKNETIAHRLCISTNTVKTHVYNIFKKINVPNRLQAAFWAARNL